MTRRKRAEPATTAMESPCRVDLAGTRTGDERAGWRATAGGVLADASTEIRAAAIVVGTGAAVVGVAVVDGDVEVDVGLGALVVTGAGALVVGGATGRMTTGALAVLGRMNTWVVHTTPWASVTVPTPVMVNSGSDMLRMWGGLATRASKI